MTNYKEDLWADLADPEYAAMYVDDALLAASAEEFLLALRDVAESKKMSVIAGSAQLNRESMYRMLSGSGNPRLSSLSAILSALGLRLRVEAIPLPHRVNPGQNDRSASGQLLYNQARKTSGQIDAPLRRRGPERAETIGNVWLTRYSELGSMKQGSHQSGG